MSGDSVPVGQVPGDVRMTIRKFDTNLTSQDSRDFSFALLNNQGFVPDILHDVKALTVAMAGMFSTSATPWVIVQPDGHMGGVFFIGDIIPEHEGTLYLWVWDKSCWSPDVAGFVREYVNHVAESYLLRRLVARTPCARLGKMLDGCLGFRVEGRFKKAWKAGGVCSTLFQHRLLFSNMEA